MRRVVSAAACFSVLATLSGAPAHSGVFADDLARCLVRSTTPEDRALLRKWSFALMATDPDLAGLSKIDGATHAALDKETGEMMVHLLVDMCQKEAVTAVQSEGPGVMFGTFAALGQYAQGEMMQKPEVVASLKNFGKFSGAPKLKALMAQASPATQTESSSSK